MLHNGMMMNVVFMRLSLSDVAIAAAVLRVSLEEQLYEVGESTAIDRHLAVLICVLATEIETFSSIFVTLSTVNGTAKGTHHNANLYNSTRSYCLDII